MRLARGMVGARDPRGQVIDEQPRYRVKPDTIGSTQTVETSLRLLATGGTLIVSGVVTAGSAVPEVEASDGP